MTEPIFFYSEICPICPAVLVECVRYFASRNIRLLVRKPYISERKKLPGLPALYLSAEFCRTTQPHVLVGADIPQWLAELDDRKMKESAK